MADHDYVDETVSLDDSVPAMGFEKAFADLLGAVQSWRTQMEALLYFAFWAAIVFLMMRFGCGAHVMGHGHGGKRSPGQTTTREQSELRWVAPKEDMDPVCGKTVRTQDAKSSVYEGTVYYFCSRECREAFEAAPGTYLGGDKSAIKELEHSHV